MSAAAGAIDVFAAGGGGIFLSNEKDKMTISQLRAVVAELKEKVRTRDVCIEKLKVRDLSEGERRL